MRRGGIKIAAWMVAAVGLAGCASDRAAYEAYPEAPEAGFETPGPSAQSGPLQCVPYARAHSAVKLYGDAWTWWDKASGKFSRGAVPETGAVLVLTGYAGPERGHVAVVRSLISSREIRVDHANWLGDGAIYLDDPVADVSADNDWSIVRVWNVKAGAWGARTYPVQGFIGPGSGQIPVPPALDEDADPARIARAELGIPQ